MENARGERAFSGRQLGGSWGLLLSTQRLWGAGGCFQHPTGRWGGVERDLCNSNNFLWERPAAPPDGGTTPGAPPFTAGGVCISSEGVGGGETPTPATRIPATSATTTILRWV